MKFTDLWISTSIPCPSPNMSFTKSKHRYAMDDKELEAHVGNLHRSKIPRVVQHMLEFQLHLGARIGEVCAITAAWVREELDYIDLPATATKNGTSHRFLLTERTKNIVKQHLEREEKFLFRRDDDGNPFNPSRIQQMLAASREVMGIGSRYDWGADLWPQAREALER